MPQEDKLNSWKEIAGYLGRDVRTVLRWEKERGLPIRCIPGGKKRRVFACPDELEAWLGMGASARQRSDGKPAPGAPQRVST